MNSHTVKKSEIKNVHIFIVIYIYIIYIFFNFDSNIILQYIFFVVCAYVFSYSDVIYLFIQKCSILKLLKRYKSRVVSQDIMRSKRTREWLGQNIFSK